jgi:hypothetical protein
MHLVIAREALDTHFRLIMPIVMPHLADKKASKASLIMKALKFYAGWYPKMWLPGGPDLAVKHLDAKNREHLAYINKTCKRLARTIFHTMMKYQKKLETEQLLLTNMVDIGVDLLMMAVTLARAEQTEAEGVTQDHSPQKLADLFCRNARQRVAANFQALKQNHNRLFDHVAGDLMQGKFRWMINDIMEDYPKNWRDWETVAKELEPVVEEAAHAK